MDPNNDLNMENNEFPEIIEDDDSVEDDDEELDNSGRSSSASPMIWSIHDESSMSEESQGAVVEADEDLNLQRLRSRIRVIVGDTDSFTRNISQQPSGSQSAQNILEPQRSSPYYEISSTSSSDDDEETPLRLYNPQLGLHGHFRTHSAVTAASIQSMGPGGSQQTSCSNSAQNIATSSTSANNDDSESADEAFACPICLGGVNSSGGHKPVCLKCGHIFGEECIVRWIKNGCNGTARRCPTCNTKTNLKEIRVIYAKRLIAVDTAEMDNVQNKLEKEIKKNTILTRESQALVEKAEHLSEENVKLRKIISDGNLQANVPSTKRSLIKNIKLCRTSGCRVMAYNKTNMMLVMSHTPETTLFNKQVIRKMNTTLMIPLEENIYAHTKQIRDMAFHPIEHQVLASVGLDKCINMIDVMSNTVISSIAVDEPLWSCCWAGDNSNMLVAGSQTGSLYYIDKRFMKLLYSENKRTPACVSLVSIPPSSTRKFSKGGFLRTRMDMLSMFESSVTPNLYQETKLPLHGLWSCASYDSRYNHILLSSKPCGNTKTTRHVVSRMSSLNEDCPTVLPVVTFYGGDKATLLSRSCFVPPKETCDETLVAYFDEKSSSIQLSSLNSNCNVHKFYVQESFLDLCHLDGVVINSRRVLAALSTKSISIYCV